MTELPRVTNALREANNELPQDAKPADILYILDVEPSGAESIVVYVEMKTGASVSAERKRDIEAKFRKRLAESGHPTAYFRWLVESERSATVSTKSGLRDKPVSALRASRH